MVSIETLGSTLDEKLSITIARVAVMVIFIIIIFCRALQHWNRHLLGLSCMFLVPLSPDAMKFSHPQDHQHSTAIISLHYSYPESVVVLFRKNDDDPSNAFLQKERAGDDRGKSLLVFY